MRRREIAITLGLLLPLLGCGKGELRQLMESESGLVEEVVVTVQITQGAVGGGRLVFEKGGEVSCRFNTANNTSLVPVLLKGTLAPEAFEQLSADLIRADFFFLESSYSNPGATILPPATTTFTVAAEGRSRSVRNRYVAGGINDPGYPEEISALEGAIATARAQVQWTSLPAAGLQPPCL